MASITTWTRLEPRSRNADMDVGLAARVHDPLWFVARQWQLGELSAQDAGTPVEAHVRASVGRIERYHAGAPTGDASAPSMPVDDREIPLEAIVERESLDVATAPRLSTELGAHFVRMLRAAGQAVHGAAFAGEFGRPASGGAPSADPAGELFERLIGSRVPDGLTMRRQLLDAIDAGTFDARLGTLGLGADEAAVAEVVRSWLEWTAGTVTEAPDGVDAWDPERLEYRFAVGARVGERELTLLADEYAQGELDWYAFDAAAGASLGASAASESIVRRLIPTPVEYSGMPNPRWWEFEDAVVDFGAIDGSADDLTRMLLVEFAVVYGNDWFTIPVDLPVGAACQVESFVVTDTFGVRTVVHPASASGSAAWRMFSISGAPPEVFFLPPTLAGSVDGPVRERIVFTRDEMANLAWAIEETVESATGSPRRRDEEAVGRQEPPGGVPADPDGRFELRYRVRTDVPPHWFPMVTVARPGLPAIELELRTLVGASGAGPSPHGVVLNDVAPMLVVDSEVPREGANVERAYQLSRWMGGRTVAWSGRRVRVGRGPTVSGLRHDVADPA